MRENNYSPLKNIDYYNLEVYIESREDIKKCLWRVINKFEYLSNTFYMALYFLDKIMVKHYKSIQITNLDILSIGCIIIASKF